MHSAVLIIFIPLVVFGLMEVYPRFFIPVIAAMRRRFRHHLINRYGKKIAKLVVQDLRRRYAAQGYDMEEFDTVISTCMPELIEHFGQEYADEFMGEPCAIERYF